MDHPEAIIAARDRAPLRQSAAQGHVRDVRARPGRVQVLRPLRRHRTTGARARSQASGPTAKRSRDTPVLMVPGVVVASDDTIATALVVLRLALVLA